MDVEAVIGRRAPRQGRRRHALLHGRRLARAQGPRHRRRSASMVRGVKALGLETCATLGMLTGSQAQRAQATPASTTTTTTSTPRPDFYGNIITTRALPGPARHAGARARRRHEGLLRRHRRHGRERAQQRAGLMAHAGQPGSASGIGADQRLVQVEGTPLDGTRALDPFEFVRTIAVARITMPQARGAPVGRPRSR